LNRRRDEKGYAVQVSDTTMTIKELKPVPIEIKTI
jgi:hypothetical protein